MTTTHLFTGYERDAESALDHTWFRQYSSAQARWLSPDPLGGSLSDPQSLNRYSYVLNDPLNYVDPLGLCAFYVNRFVETENGPGYWTVDGYFCGGGGGGGAQPCVQPAGRVPGPNDCPDGPGGDGPGEGPPSKPEKPNEPSRLATCALSYYGIDPLSVAGLTSNGKWALIAAAAGGIPKAVPDSLGMRVITLPGSSRFTSLLSMVSVASGGGALRTIANFGSKWAVPVAIASAVIDATAIGICTALD